MPPPAPTPTLRLPAPPPPPKPLHLTISMRGDKDKKSNYPQMPSWSQQSSVSGEEPEEQGGTVRGGGYARGSGEDREEEWTTARSRQQAMPSLNNLFLEAGGAEELDAPRYARRKSRRVPSGFSEGGKSTRGTLKGSSTIKRTSIFFDPHQPNPFVPPALPPLPSPSPPVEESDEVFKALEDPESQPQEDDENDENLLDLPPSLLALSLHSFAGEAAFGELSFEGGVELCIEVEDLGGGWSLGFEKEKGEEGRGLIPRGWYAYVEHPPELLDPTDSSTTASSVSAPSTPPPSLPTPPDSLPPDSPPTPSVPLTLPLHSGSPLTPPVPQPLSPDPPTLLHDPLTPPSPPPPSRSIGRSIIISGIEFEPLESLPSTPSSAQVFSPSIPDWLLSPEPESETRVSPVLTVGEMEGFFAGSKGEEGYKEEPPGEMEDQRPEHQPEGSEDTLRPFADVDPSPHVDLWFDISAVPDELPLALELEPTLASVLEEEEEGEGELDTQEAREARWAAVVESAERSASSATSLEEEDESGFPWTSSKASLASSIVEEPLAAELPPAKEDVSPLSRTSTMMFCLGMGTVRSGYSVTSIGLGTTRSSSSSSVSGTLRARGRGKGLVQDWILRGENSGSSAGDTSYHIESGPAWRHDSPPFTVHVHSPEKRSSTTAKADYTVFQLTTVFSTSESEADDPPLTMTVERRYSHFTLLHALLVDRYPVLVVPPVPVKSYAGRFQEQFVETRRRDLERWCARIGRHPVLGTTEEVRGFLGTESDSELRNLLMPSKSTSSSPAAFFVHVFHPEFNIHHSDAQELVERFEKHTKAIEVGGGVKDVESSVGRVREGLRDHAANLRVLAHSIVRLVAGLALPPVTSEEKDGDDAVGDQESDGERDRRRALALYVLNEEGALSWKEGCEESLSLAKAVQATAESVSAVADLYDNNARDTMLPVQELLRESAYPNSQHSALIDTHKLALVQHQELTEATPALNDADSHAHEEALSRAETILNITSAEIERGHSERTEDLKNVSAQYLQGQIDFHEQALAHLRFALTHFDPDSFSALAHTGPRLRSILERPPTSPRPLPVPSNYGIPTSVLGVSSSLGRPVEVVGEVLSETVGNVLGFRGGAPPVVYLSRGGATAGTVGRSAAEILRGQDRAAEGRTTWRQSIFGSSRIW